MTVHVARFAGAARGQPIDVARRARTFPEAIDAVLEPIDDIHVEASDTAFQAIDTRFRGIDTRFRAIDTRFRAIDTRFRAIDTRFRGSMGNVVSGKEAGDGVVHKLTDRARGAGYGPVRIRPWRGGERSSWHAAPASLWTTPRGGGARVSGVRGARRCVQLGKTNDPEQVCRLPGVTMDQ
jgi:hypothetical protein